MVNPSLIPDPPEWLCIGQIVAAHGLHGDVRIKAFSDFPERFTTPGHRWLRNTPQGTPDPVTLVRGRFLPRSEQFVVTFAEICDRTTAEQLKGSEILVPASDRPSLAANEYHLMDLIGLDVYEGDRHVGRVVGLVKAGNDLLEVAPPETTTPYVYIPFVPAIVTQIDLEHQRIQIDPPFGLLP